MSNSQFWAGIVIVILGTAVSHFGLRDRLNQLETRLGQIGADLRQFYKDLGRHEADIDTLKKRG